MVKSVLRTPTARMCLGRSGAYVMKDSNWNQEREHAEVIPILGL